MFHGIIFLNSYSQSHFNIVFNFHFSNASSIFHVLIFKVPRHTFMITHGFCFICFFLLSLHEFTYLCVIFAPSFWYVRSFVTKPSARNFGTPAKSFERAFTKSVLLVTLGSEPYSGLILVTSYRNGCLPQSPTITNNDRRLAHGVFFHLQRNVVSPLRIHTPTDLFTTRPRSVSTRRRPHPRGRGTGGASSTWSSAPISSTPDYPCAGLAPRPGPSRRRAPTSGWRRPNHANCSSPVRL